MFLKTTRLGNRAKWRQNTRTTDPSDGNNNGEERARKIISSGMFIKRRHSSG